MVLKVFDVIAVSIAYVNIKITNGKQVDVWKWNNPDHQS